MNSGYVVGLSRDDRERFGFRIPTPPPARWEIDAANQQAARKFRMGMIAALEDQGEVVPYGRHPREMV